MQTTLGQYIKMNLDKMPIERIRANLKLQSINRSHVNDETTIVIVQDITKKVVAIGDKVYDRVAMEETKKADKEKELRDRMLKMVDPDAKNYSYDENGNPIVDEPPAQPAQEDE